MHPVGIACELGPLVVVPLALNFTIAGDRHAAKLLWGKFRVGTTLPGHRVFMAVRFISRRSRKELEPSTPALSARNVRRAVLLLFA